MTRHDARRDTPLFEMMEGRTLMSSAGLDCGPNPQPMPDPLPLPGPFPIVVQVDESGEGQQDDAKDDSQPSAESDALKEGQFGVIQPDGTVTPLDSAMGEVRINPLEGSSQDGPTRIKITLLDNEGNPVRTIEGELSGDTSENGATGIGSFTWNPVRGSVRDFNNHARNVQGGSGFTLDAVRAINDASQEPGETHTPQMQSSGFHGANLFGYDFLPDRDLTTTETMPTP